MSTKTKYLIVFITLVILDAVPFIPVIGTIGVYIILKKPPWFERVVLRLYHEDRPPAGAKG